MTPRIAIPIPTSIDPSYNQRSWPTYASAVSRSGGEPVAIDITLPASEILSLARTCHGIVLPGSPADVDPALYGAERIPECGPADTFREAADRILLDHAESTSKPVLAICYGVQFLNVWRGGSLIQDLSPLPVNHSAGSSVAIAHTALVAPQSLLAALITPEEAPLSGDFLRLPMNTSHHQSVAAPGNGLRIVARCPDDGVIEAMELDPEFTSGSPMFHVEHSEPASSKMFHVEHSPTPSAAPESKVDESAIHVSETQEALKAEVRSESIKMFHVEHSSFPSTTNEHEPGPGETWTDETKTDQTGTPRAITARLDPETSKMFHVEHSRPWFVLGVQWHPERSYDISPASRALFDRLIAETVR